MELYRSGIYAIVTERGFFGFTNYVIMRDTATDRPSRYCAASSLRVAVYRARRLARCEARA